MSMHPGRSNWPLAHEYDDALLNRRTTFSDPAIRRGELQEIAGQPQRLNAGGSGHVCVYRVGDWVVRCFASDPPKSVYPPPDIVQRYSTITAYLKRMGHGLPFLVPHEWVQSGVNIKGTRFPYLKLPYIAGCSTLGDFLIDHYQNTNVVTHITTQWLDIIRQLEEKQIAHGDLDSSNILVSGTYPAFSLHLIDFDGMYIPDFSNTSIRNVADNGHPDFQPAQPGIRQFGPTMDRFSALIIYLSLRALEIRPSLWDDCGANDRTLLLRSEDYERLSQSVRFPLLRQEHGNGSLQLCLDELQASIDQGRTPRSLSEILQPSPYVSVQSAPEQYRGRGLIIPLDEPVVSDDKLPLPDTIPASPINPAPPTGTSGYTPAPASSTGHRHIWIAAVIVIFIILALLLSLLFANGQRSQSSQPASWYTTIQTYHFLSREEVDMIGANT